MHEYSSNVLLDQISALTDGWDGSIERRYCHLSNVSALLAQYFEKINWVGFYLMKEDRTGLVLGPFQGKVACTDISLEHGVCGAAARAKESLRVEDVHAFPGHIACDSASNSELVVPLLAGDNAVVGVLDVDSPYKGRFSKEDQQMLESVALIISKALWT